MADDFISVFTDLIRATLEAPWDPDEPVADESWTEVWDSVDQLEAKAQQAVSAADTLAWAGFVIEWRSQFLALAEAIVTRRGTDTQHAVEDLLVRAMQERMPRLASVLTLLGVIIAIPDAQAPGEVRYDLDWEGVLELLVDAAAWLTDKILDGLGLTDPDTDQNGDPPPDQDTGSVPSVIGALGLMAPHTIPMIFSGDLKVAPVPFPPTQSDPGHVWTQFRDKSREWVNFTLIRKPDTPLPPDDPVQKDRHLFGLVSDADPDKTFTFALRSKRYKNQSGDWVSDFEVWLMFVPEEEEFRLPDEGRRYLRIAPATLMGFGYDGGAATWRSFIDPNSQFLPPRPDDPAVIEFVNEDIAGQPDILIGSLHDSHLVVRDIGAWLKLYQDEPFFEAGVKLHGLSMLLMPSVFGPVNKFLRDGIHLDLDLDISFVNGVGLTMNRAGGLEALWVFNIGIWGITLHSVRLVGEAKTITVTNPDGSTSKQLRWRVALRLHFSVELWKFLLVVDGAGAWFGLWGGSDPDAWGIDPWLGIGIGIEDDNIQGGGFLSRYDGVAPVVEEFSGLVYLKIGTFEVLAFAIYKTMEDGTDSFIMVLGTRFQPGITLPYGLQLQGVGGLIAINRRADTDRLWQRLTIGTIGTILTADDPVKNAPIILGDLDYLFPVTSGVHLFGPTFSFLWLKQVKFDIAVIAEIATSGNAYGTAGVTKLVVLGTARLERKASNRKLLDITLNLVGILDSVKNLLAIDAVLHKSKVLEIFKATGTAAVRMSWGSRPYLMVTVGGFHPKFNPEPAVFPKLDRVGLAYVGKFKDDLTLRAEAYLAVTSNSIQAGLKVEARVKKGKLVAEGILVIDALIQFVPFYFDVAISVKVGVRYGSRTIAGVTLVGGISGPGPVTIYGKFCIEILFFDLCWSGSFSFGNPVTQILETVASLLDALLPELEAPGNLESDGADDRLVIINTATVENGVPVLPPTGGLVWTQQRTPLNCLVERFEGTPLSAAEAVVATVLGATIAPVFEWFSPGSFSDLNDSEALNQQAFERLQSGIRIGLDELASDPVGKNMGVNKYYLPEPRSGSALAAVSVPALMVDSVDGRQAASGDFQRKAGTVQLRPSGWSVRDGAGAATHSGLSQTDAHRRAKHAKAMALPDIDIVTLHI
ncbi:MAG: hypothetical protein H6649_01150 [Caldilineae bacterium]|nr:hypothetical protein [Caldilineae bacterium]